METMRTIETIHINGKMRTTFHFCDTWGAHGSSLPSGKLFV